MPPIASLVVELVPDTTRLHSEMTAASNRLGELHREVDRVNRKIGRVGLAWLASYAGLFVGIALGHLL